MADISPENENISMQQRREKVIARLEARRQDSNKRVVTAGAQGNDPTVKHFQDSLQQFTERLGVLFDDHQVQSDRKQQLVLVTHIQNECSAMDRLLTVYIDRLPSYDARKAQQILQETRVRLQSITASSQPKQKFAFSKNSAAAPSPETVPDDNKPNVSNSKIDPSNVPEAKATPKATSFSFLESTATEYSDRTNETIDISDCDGKEVRIANMSDCMINVQCTPLTMYLHALDRCTVLARPVHTSVIIDGAKACTFVLAAQQLRMHEAEGCKLYIHMTTPGIIEHCSQIELGRYPYKDALNEHFEKAGLDRLKCAGLELKDFDWLATDRHSPNWTVIGGEDGIAFEVL